MKRAPLIAIATFFLSFATHSHTVETAFSQDSVIPADLQEKILALVLKRCDPTPLTFVELHTETSYEISSKGSMDFYETTFTLSTAGADQKPVTFALKVKSAIYEFAAANGSHLKILGFSSENLTCK